MSMHEVATSEVAFAITPSQVCVPNKHQAVWNDRKKEIPSSFANQRISEQRASMIDRCCVLGLCAKHKRLHMQCGDNHYLALFVIARHFNCDSVSNVQFIQYSIHILISIVISINQYMRKFHSSSIVFRSCDTPNVPFFCCCLTIELCRCVLLFIGEQIEFHPIQSMTVIFVAYICFSLCSDRSSVVRAIDNPSSQTRWCDDLAN